MEKKKSIGQTNAERARELKSAGKSVREIAKILGISESGVYNYFSRKKKTIKGHAPKFIDVAPPPARQSDQVMVMIMSLENAKRLAMQGWLK
jgi:transposase